MHGHHGFADMGTHLSEAAVHSSRSHGLFRFVHGRMDGRVVMCQHDSIATAPADGCVQRDPLSCSVGRNIWWLCRNVHHQAMRPRDPWSAFGVFMTTVLLRFVEWEMKFVSLCLLLGFYGIRRSIQ